jgi:ribonuclease P protein component
MFETLKKRASFLELQNSKESWATKTIILQRKKNELEQNRYGFTVSKRISKRAVDRNLIKRRLKAIIREIAAEKFGTGFDYVIIARKDALTRKYSDLLGDVEYALKKIEKNSASLGLIQVSNAVAEVNFRVKPKIEGAGS